jgi:hypothetical protein
MKIVETCKHCEHGRIDFMICPCCWGTTVSPKALDEAKAELERIRGVYAAKKTASKELRGAARGMAGHELARIAEIGRALRDEVTRIETLATMNKAAARLVGAAAG